MATQAQNAAAILDALADSIGKTLTSQQKLDWVERFIKQTDGTNEEKATKFNSYFVDLIRSTGRNHTIQNLAAAQAAANEAAADAIADEL
jgi:hypothetical protein